MTNEFVYALGTLLLSWEFFKADAIISTTDAERPLS